MAEPLFVKHQPASLAKFNTINNAKVLALNSRFQVVKVHLGQLAIIPELMAEPLFVKYQPASLAKFNTISNAKVLALNGKPERNDRRSKADPT